MGVKPRHALIYVETVNLKGQYNGQQTKFYGKIENQMAAIDCWSCWLFGRLICFQNACKLGSLNLIIAQGNVNRGDNQYCKQG